MKLVTADQMREIDRVSIEERGISGIQLMTAAGRAIALDVADNLEMGSVVLLCGKGNNGGDGFIAARFLHRAGWKAVVVIVDEPQQGDARTAWEQLPPEIEIRSFSDLNDPVAYFAGFDAAVDALLGTGTKGRPRPPFDAIIEALNAARIPVFSADIPSGLHPDNGTAELAVRAARTITMGLPKVGMVSGDGPSYCGSIRVEPLDFPADLLAAEDSPYNTMSPVEAAALLPNRPRDGHKGTFGMLLVAAGSDPMPGAAVLAAGGALRAGCGLVRVLTTPVVRSAVANHLPEVILTEVPSSGPYLVPMAAEEREQILLRVTAIAAGPGIGTNEKTGKFLASLLETETHLPMVIDADALNLLADDPVLADKLTPRCVLTPHPGEMGRLLGVPTSDVQADRWTAARDAAKKFGCIVLLKGYGTIVAEPDGTATHIPSGNTAWARGGSGDVLTGVIGSLLAQGCKPADAAKLGAFVHGLAADIYTRDRSPRGATTTEIAALLPMAFRELETIHG